uniref:CSON009440 protein n=1 Tax=Culicoides sonorensis TaxID=179676 RepID=A0A336KEK7_CULSO
MLNCTDLACVLHHHHFYAHLHHLKHHLSDDHHDSVDYHHETQSEAPPTGYHVESNDEASIQSLLNDTESDLSQLSHLGEYLSISISNFILIIVLFDQNMKKKINLDGENVLKGVLRLEFEELDHDKMTFIIKKITKIGMKWAEKGLFNGK